LPKKSLILPTWNASPFVLNFRLPTLEEKYEATRCDLNLLQPLVNGLLGASCKMNPFAGRCQNLIAPSTMRE
jgi:hypothetical protein